ncbi:FIST signal transduction protein [Falsiroseomonas sp.]|uniref:FIST signal transduction protein n=1 Tax=Falsiroseomonas sp. TaxID=2870721 RepID=UPI003F71BE0E
MRAATLRWSPAEGWHGVVPAAAAGPCLVLYVAGREALESGERHRELRAAFPGAIVAGCSTGGQIDESDVVDEGVQALKLDFAASRLRLATERLAGEGASRDCGRRLGAALAAPDLAGVLLISEGLAVNAGDLVAGLQEAIGAGVPIVGGLAGDGPHFRRTLVGAGEEAPTPGLVAAIGFVGSAVRFGHGCASGWDAFGPLRSITASEGRVLRELDGEPALDLYERYLGPEAAGLPGTGLLYPLRIWDAGEPRHDVLRTLLGVDREARTLIFAADLPVGWRAQLMRGRFGGLAEGAAEAAAGAGGGSAAAGDSAAFIVSCVGRRLMMGQRVEEEVLAARECLPASMRVLGFYSYGEIAPHPMTGRSELHNQTMTVLTLTETAA